jgi:hypothetical protein
MTKEWNMPRLPALTPRGRAKKRARANAKVAARRAANAVAATVTAPVAAAQLGGKAVKESASARARSIVRAASRAGDLGTGTVRRAASESGRAVESAGARIRAGAISVRERPAERARARARRRRAARARFAFGSFAGLAAGYVIGARAGRERYEQLRAAARDLAADPRFKQLSAQSGDTLRNAGERAGKLADRAASSAADVLRRRREGSEGREADVPTGNRV